MGKHFIDIDSKELRNFTHTLEKISRSALPVAIRQTLNDAAYDVKLRTMPQTSDASFIKRKPTFWKAKSRVEGAKGFDVDTMQSTVGFLEGKKHSQAVRDLDEQEHGGKIDDKDFIAMDEARTGNSNSRQVRKKNWLGTIDPVFKTTKWNGRFPSSWIQAGKITTDRFGKKITSNKAKWFQAVYTAKKGQYILGTGKSKTLYRKDVTGEGPSLKMQLTPLYSFEKGRKVKVKGKHFMENAALKSAQSLDKFFYKNGTRQINKIK